MARIHGLLLVQKPSGVTSHDVVSRVRRHLGIKEVGHAGTLDPLAEGLMVLLLGEATKLSSYVLEQDKQYIVTLKLGIVTDTLDITGKITNLNPVTNNNDELIKSALNLNGEFLWEVPLYSATKVSGQKLYEQARRGEKPLDIPYKSMKFWDIDSLGTTAENSFRFRLNCSKGSFVRTWVHQLGKQIGCGAVMTELIRTVSTPYALENAIELDKVSIKNLSDHKSYIPMLSTLPNFKIIHVNGHSESLIRNGQISHELRRHLISIFNPDTDLGVKILSQRPEELLALVGNEKDKGFIVRRVFRY